MMALIRKWIAGLLIKNVRAFKSPSGACARAFPMESRAPTCVDARNSGCYYVTPLIFYTREALPRSKVKGGGPSPLNNPPWTRIHLQVRGEVPLPPNNPPARGALPP